MSEALIHERHRSVGAPGSFEMTGQLEESILPGQNPTPDEFGGVVEGPVLPEVASQRLARFSSDHTGVTAPRVTESLPETASTRLSMEDGRTSGNSPMRRKLAKVAILAVGIFGAHAAMPEKAEGAYNWHEVGGDPLFQGGIHSTKEAAKAFLSPTGTVTLIRMGYNRRERTNIRKAARAGEIDECIIPKHTNKMSYHGADPIVVQDVTLTDPDHPNGLKGWCMTVKDKFKKAGKTHTQIIKIGIAEICGNVTEMQNQTKTAAKPKTPAVRAGKIFEDADGKRLPFFPGVARVEWQCGKDGKFRLVTLQEPVQVLGRCAVGKRVTVREKDTMGADGRPHPIAIGGQAPPAGAHWEVLTPRSVTRARMPKEGVLVRFKNRQLKPDTPERVYVCPTGTNWVDRNGNLVIDQDECIAPPPPPNPTPTPGPVNNPPDLITKYWEHIIEGGRLEICASATDPDPGDSIMRVDIRSDRPDLLSFSASGRPDPINYPDKWCAIGTAGQVNADTRVKVTAIATDGELSSDPEGQSPSSPGHPDRRRGWFITTIVNREFKANR